MFDSATPDHANPAPAPGPDPGVDPGFDHQLPADAYYHLVSTLRLTLPPPGGSPEDFRRRDHAAIAAVAALAPANAAEAKLAAQFVAASEQWTDCLRLAQQPETTPEWDCLRHAQDPRRTAERALKCRAQAASMMRQANSALRLLLGAQNARRKLEADNVACDRLARTEHVALRLMAEALAHIRADADQLSPPSPEQALAHIRADANPLPPPSPAETGAHSAAEPAEPSRAPASAEQAKPTAPAAIPEPPLTGAAASRRLEETDPELIAAAERYAATYPERAAQIRRTGKLPYDIRYFEPSEFAFARALVAARTPALLALDQAFPDARPVPRDGATAA